MKKVENSTKFASKYKLKSSRLQNFDYSTPGIYFITVCTLNKNNFFGKIINNQMDLSKMGIITQRCLIDIPNHFKNVFIDEFVVMPNHVHFLIKITESSRDVACNVSTNQHNVSTNQKDEYFSKISPKPNSIPTIVRSFKSAVTCQINPKTIFFAWQSRYHDIIIKDNKELLVIRNYIINNPINWQKDKFYSRDVACNVSTNINNVSTK